MGLAQKLQVLNAPPYRHIQLMSVDNTTECDPTGLSRCGFSKQVIVPRKENPAQRR